jgi:2-polyprenyl-6-methoxyphenol hydroxylase-like FAD-dependent oxidoreductase
VKGEGRGEEIDVAIVGAGFAGLALACFLAERGREARVLERRPELPKTGAGIIVQPNGLAALERLQVLEGTLARGCRIERASLRDLRDRELAVSDYGELRHPHPYIVEIRRIDLLRLLSERLHQLGGAQPLTGHELSGLIREGDRPAGVRYRRGTEEHELRARCVVGADGARSRVRAELGIPVRRAGREDPYVLGIVRAPAGLDLTDLRIYYGPGYGNGVVPLGEHVYFWDHVTPENREAVERRDLAGWRAVYAERLPLGADIAAAIPSFEELSVLAGRTQWARARIAEGAALAGDAAATVHPHAGQGANLALEDAVALGEVLAAQDRGPVTRHALEPYARARHRKGLLYVAWSLLAARSFDAPTPAWRAVRTLNSYWNRVPPVRRALLRTMAGLRGPDADRSG